jgi:hypothetical protein
MSSRPLNPEYEVRLQEADRLLDELVAAPAVALTNFGAVPGKPGVYVISEGGSDLYVGRTKNLKQRFRNHTSGRPEQSSFAFRLARKDSGNIKATYKHIGSRKNLMGDVRFKKSFDQNVTRVRGMTARYVLINCPLMQHMFEVYAAISLRTPFNEFATS